MNKKYQYISLVWIIFFSFLFPKLSLAETIEQQIRKTGILRVGMRYDSELFGFKNNKKGYCAEFADVLSLELSRKLKQEIKVEPIESTTQNRWNLVKNGEVHLECGPNTILDGLEREHGITFSTPFFYTEMQVFAKKTNQTEEIFKSGIIGVIKETTSEMLLREIYSPKKIDSSFESIKSGIDAVTNNEIQGFLSDGILLQEAVLSTSINTESYEFITFKYDEEPICESYGMILPDEENYPHWHKFVNDLIKESGNIWDILFRNYVDSLEKSLDDCDQISVAE